MIFYNILNSIIKFKTSGIESVLMSIREEEIEKVFAGHTRRRRIYDVVSLLRVFMCQTGTHGSCREAIARGVQQGWLPVTTSPGTSAYCNARIRLPEEGLRMLALRTGTLLEDELRGRWFFQDRQVKVIDGSSVQLPDTPENQAEYPQPAGQKKGCGFPVMSISVLMGLDSGGIIDVETTSGTGYEHPMFRELWRSLKKGDIVLGDAGYGSYAEIARLTEMGIDCVFKKGIRKFKPKEAVRIGDGEWLQTWDRPSSPGEWIDKDHLRESITVRVIRAVVGRKGYRCRKITLITTLLDPDKYPKAKLVELYQRRWEMELRFRDIKTTMKLEMLRCKTPSGCRKELWVGLLLYNIIRSLMLDAAIRHKISVSRISYAGTLAGFNETCVGILVRVDPLLAYEVLIRSIADCQNPYRPERIEPRKLKRRPKNYRLLMLPRELERRLLKIGNTT